MKKFIIIASILASTSINAETFIGKVRVVDGDTIHYKSGPKIRLHGIDAPEKSQKPWGVKASIHLKNMLKPTMRAKCVTTKKDRYGRYIAKCYNMRGNDLNESMVLEGYAFAYKKYSKQYVKEENLAKKAGRGLHRHSVMPPWKYRKIR